MQLLDHRTSDIIRKYEFYQNAPHLIDSEIWFESVIILNNVKPRFF